MVGVSLYYCHIFVTIDRMNASKKIRRLMEEGEAPEQLRVLKDLALALQLKRPFDVAALYRLDLQYFEVALGLLREWRFDHFIAARSKLIERLLVEALPQWPPRDTLD